MFAWSEEQREQVIAGATIVVHSPMFSGRREIKEVGETWLSFLDAGFASSVPWHFCDPSTLCLPADPRQLGLFGGKS